MREDLQKEIVLSDGVTASLNDSVLTVKGPKGEVSRNFLHPKVAVNVSEGKILLLALKATRREKTVTGSFVAHIKNMIKGVQEHHLYKLKICSGHFPMNVAVKGQELVVKNFLGESVPRRCELNPAVQVKINGTEIVVTSPDKELAGLVAARIELLCRITNRDRRIFQDGIYLTEKAGKIIGG
ncbi:50S ribosomal protein L6 [Candidatus Woesearchaeota archaeon]|jgi:large subunit ribosomal protein L6|nr:50S ribosomal protein L6 [Candidatus Woesearchaeota archaeon]MBT5739557.1 50S ribosomal protein L6 [Candidatus Woesearchaeota archaeon]